MPSRALLSAVLTALAVLLIPAAAEAKLAAAVTVETKAGKTRIVAKLTSTKTLAARQRPKTVRAVAGGRTYKLTRSGTVTGKKLGTWRSAAVTGAAATRLQALAGKRITLRIRLRSGRSAALTATVPAAAPGGGTPGTTPGGGTGSTPLFTPPGRALSGNEAFEAIKGYFLNSRFTDCVAGWPSCAVEQRYVHCPNGGWQYRRLTPSSGSDINSVGSLQVRNAAQNADGSWQVAYVAQLGSGTSDDSFSFYVWDVSAAGVVTGKYWVPASNSPANGVDRTPDQTIGPLTYAQGAPDC
jgi:hypothetical protein